MSTRVTHITQDTSAKHTDVALPATEDEAAEHMRLVHEEDDRITTRLVQHDLVRVRVDGDGNCFFACVALAIYGDDRRHQEIRSLACSYLRDRFFLTRDLCDLRPHLEEAGADSTGTYLGRMQQVGCFADYLAITATAHVYNLSFRILSSADGVRNNRLAPLDVGDYPYAAGNPRRTIKLLHVARRMLRDNSHYDLLVSPHERIPTCPRRERRVAFEK